MTDSVRPSALPRRRGPSPLPVHMGLAMSAVLGRMPEDGLDPQAMTAQNLRLAGMVQGIRKYQQYEAQLPHAATETVWRAGEVSLLFCPASGDGAPVLLVPSMINGSAIFDLLPDFSFMRFLAGQGFRVFLLDWGVPLQDDGQSTLDGVIGSRLIPALRHIAEREGRPAHLVGYCMGGTLAVAAACQEPALTASLTLMASPWDFHASEDGILSRLRLWSPYALMQIEQRGHLPVDCLQMLFASLDPDMTVRKFSRFAAMTNPGEEQNFVAVEDWLNEGRALPRAVALACIRDWYLHNVTGQGRWEIQGRAITPGEIACPTLVLASRRDRLVPRETAEALAHLIPGANFRLCDTGHIGMMAGHQAMDDVWRPVQKWLAGR